MKQFLFGIIILSSISLQSQNKFENGYIVDNQSQRKNVLVKNLDWLNNPTSVDYKISMESDEIITASVNELKEFGVGDHLKYVRFTVQIDKISNNQNRLSNNSSLNYVTETLYLKQLVDGETDLYMYTQNGGDIFFFGDDLAVSQLAYKKYMVGNNQIAENLTFKKQLYDSLKCDGLTAARIRKTDYFRKELQNLLVEYNECKGALKYKFGREDKGQKFYFGINAGVLFNTLEIKHQESTLGTDNKSANFDNSSGLRIGGILEYRLPFNNDKWRLFLETAYQSFKSEGTQEFESTNISQQTVSVDYSSIDLTLGIKHIFYISDNSLIFVRAGFTSVFDLSELVEYSGSTEDLDINSRSNLLFGLGYEFNKKINLEFILNSKRNITGDFTFTETALNNFGILLGYRIY